MSRLPPCHNYADRAYGIVIAECPIEAAQYARESAPIAPHDSDKSPPSGTHVRACVVPSKGLFTRADNRRTRYEIIVKIGNHACNVRRLQPTSTRTPPFLSLRLFAQLSQCSLFRRVVALLTPTRNHRWRSRSIFAD